MDVKKEATTAAVACDLDQVGERDLPQRKCPLSEGTRTGAFASSLPARQ